MIWIFEIELLYSKEEWQGTLEVSSSSTLEDLHFAIQDAVQFDNDHLYGFYISRTERSRDRVRFDFDDEKTYSITLEDIYPLEKRKRLYYIFDYGDSWLFKITKSRKKPKEPMQDVHYPRLIDEKGNKPEQYPEW